MRLHLTKYLLVLTKCSWRKFYLQLENTAQAQPRIVIHCFVSQSKMQVRENAHWLDTGRSGNHWFQTVFLHPLCCSGDSVRWWTHWHPATSSRFWVSFEPHQLPSLLHICAFKSTESSNQHKSQLKIWTYFVPSTIKDPRVGLNIFSRSVSMKFDLSGPNKQSVFPLSPHCSMSTHLCNQVILEHP